MTWLSSLPTTTQIAALKKLETVKHPLINLIYTNNLSGTLKVTAYPPPIPRSINGKFHVLCAILRQLHLLFYLLIQNQASTYDVFFIDSLSTCIPFLRYITGKRVVFYCHFPDKVLSMGTYSEDNRRYESLLKRLYRAPVDILEEFTTGKEIFSHAMFIYLSTTR